MLLHIAYGDCLDRRGRARNQGKEYSKEDTAEAAICKGRGGAGCMSKMFCRTMELEAAASSFG